VARRTHDVSVVTSGHNVADARLHRIVAAAVRAGLTVEVLGTGVAADGPEGAQVRSWLAAGHVRRLLRAITLPWRARGRVLLTLDPDAALGSVAARVFLRWPLVVDMHEDYAALLHDRPWARGLRRLLATRLVKVATAAAGSADLTVVADEHIPPPARRCRRRLVVRNLPDLEMLPTPTTATREPGREALRAAYVGDVRRSRGLPAMVDAVASAPTWVLDVVGPVSGEDAGWLRDRMTGADLAGRLVLHGRRPPREAWRIVSGATVGLALLDDTPAFRAAVPTKVYEYLAAGMAVIATPLPRVASLLAESGGGVIAQSSADAGRILRGWAADPEGELAELRAAARAWSATFFQDISPYDVLATELAKLAGLDSMTRQDRRGS
jgi:glycosyltransferase involved in cell wall biosynthesis